MKKMFIQEKLAELGVEVEDIIMGDFDIIGEYTAKKNRDRSHYLYKSRGCFFRPNYERGILMYYLVAKKKIKSALEIGFGRGYSTLCMAKAMCDHNIDGSIVTVDPNFNEEFLKQLHQIFPKEWFTKIEFVKLTSDEYFKKNSDKKFEFIYIDGDHRYEAVKNDWNNSKNVFTKALLFDDYCERSQQDIECSKLINEIEEYEKQLILMDRRMFFDDRYLSNENIDYGQVLIEK